MTTENAAPEQEFALQRIYVKDISFESPNAPDIFASEWEPESNLNLNSQVNNLGDDHYEVVLSLNVTAKVGDKVAYIVEVQQAGIFMVKGVPAEHMGHMMAAYCPNILFPYARETISDLVTRGSFPQLLLTPVNFDALYTQHIQEQAASAAPAPETVQ